MSAPSTALTNSTVARDHLGEFLQLLDSTNGRDKLCRLIQYGTKALKWRAEVTKQSAETIQMWNDVSANMGMVRKVLRFFRAIAILRLARAQWPTDLSKMDLPLFLNTCAKLSLASYFFWDHIVYANRMGIWKPKNPAHLKIVSTLTEGSWAGEISFSLLEALVKLGRMQGQTLTPQMELARNASLRAVVRNVLDLPVALHFMGYTGDHPHGHFGIAGAITSAISIWEMWPTINVQVPGATAAAAAPAVKK